MKYGAKLVKVPDLNDPLVAEFIGFVVGDGSICEKSLTVFCLDREVARISYLFEYSLGVKPRVYIDKPTGRRTVELKRLCLHRKSFMLWAECVGLKTVEGKRIPDSVLRGSDEVKQGFLRGLFEADGSINCRGRIDFGQANLGLLNQVVGLLESLGISCGKVCSRRQVTNSNSWLHSFFLKRSGEYKFVNDVGFMSEYKNQRVKEFYAGVLV